MEIEVWYVNDSRLKVPIADIDTLPKNDVLFIFIHVTSGRFRYYGGDFYVVGLKNDEWFVYPIDEYQEFHYVRTQTQTDRVPRKEIVEWTRPAGWTTYKFTGEAILPADWDDLLEESEILVSR